MVLTHNASLLARGNRLSMSLPSKIRDRALCIHRRALYSSSILTS